jgi:hypothetical protein
MRLASSLAVLSLLTFPALAPTSAQADSSVTVNLSPEGRALAVAAGTTAENLANQIKAEVEDAYQTNDVSGFLTAFTDATAFSQRGLAVDYVSTPSSFIIGFGGNVSVAGEDSFDSDDSPTAGAAINLGLMLGANLAGQGLPRWTLYGNAFYNEASTDRLKGNLTSAGAHAQVKLIKPAQDKGIARAFRWIGLDATSGIEYTRWSLDAANDLENDFTVSGYDLTMISNGTFNLTSDAITVPIELTTGFRVLGLLSVYGGAGVDFTYGTSSIDANLTGGVTTSAAGTDVNVGTVAITADGEGDGSPTALHALVGAQVNLWKLKIFTQANVSQTPAASVSFGIRLVL